MKVAKWSLPILIMLCVPAAPPAFAGLFDNLPGRLLPQPALTPTETAPPANSTDDSTDAKLAIPVLEQAVFEEVNRYRTSIGLAPLQLDTRISQQARAHSQAMATKRLPFGHHDFRQRARRVDRIIRSRRVSETVAYIFTHQDTAKRAVQGWVKSPRHRPILVGNYRVTGVGVAQGDRGAFYFTQIYVRPR
jgi:uncharacterized protein YkwD